MTFTIKDDIIMKDNTYNFNNYNNFNTYHSFHFPFSNLISPRKRTYLDMLQNSNRIFLNNRIDNYNYYNKIRNEHSLFNSINNEDKRHNSLINNFNNFEDVNKAKKNLVIKKNIEYDEEKERRWVQNYYRIKNAELNRLRFGKE